jgi:hypothetical protein
MYRLALVLTVLMSSYLGFAQEVDPQFKDPQNMKVDPENTDCHKIPDTFENLSEALETIDSTRFYYDQRIKTTRKSGLMQARYVSCDFETGYLIVRFDGMDRVYPDIKLELWESFQQTADIDGYYLKEVEHLPKLNN